MRKILIAAVAALAAFMGCTKNELKPMASPEDVSVSIGYVLSASGDMTKSTNNDVWMMFYEKMKSGDLVAPKYQLTFTETTTGAVYVFYGEWESDGMVTLQTGKYHVTGTSTASGNYIQEYASLSFDTTMEISASTTNVVLTADYDCFLLAFAKSDITELKNYSGNSNFADKKDFWLLNEYYYAFVNDTMYHDNTGHICGYRGANLLRFEIKTSKANFEKGKYYIYNDVGSDFELPQMTPGL